MAAGDREQGDRELRGRVLDEYLADVEQRVGPFPEAERERARREFTGLLGGDQPGGGQPRC